MPKIVRDQKSRLLAGLRFLFCAIPGLFLFLVFSTALFGTFFDPSDNYPNPLISFGVVAASSVLMLFGVDKWKQWRYLLVFLSIPASLFGYILVAKGASGGKLAPGIIVGILAFLTLYFVRLFDPKAKPPAKGNK
jgi:hypothetical protein